MKARSRDVSRGDSFSRRTRQAALRREAREGEMWRCARFGRRCPANLQFFGFSLCWTSALRISRISSRDTVAIYTHSSVVARHAFGTRKLVSTSDVTAQCPAYIWSSQRVPTRSTTSRRKRHRRRRTRTTRPTSSSWLPVCCHICDCVDHMVLTLGARQEGSRRDGQEGRGQGSPRRRRHQEVGQEMNYTNLTIDG